MKRNLFVFAAGAGILVFAFARALAPGHANIVQTVAATAAFAAVALHAFTADEVARGLMLRAGATAFFICLALAVAAAVLHPDASWVAYYAWAVMMGVWLVSWFALRVRLG